MAYHDVVDNLVSNGALRTPRIIKAFYAADRIHFLRPEDRDRAGIDAAIPLGGGQTISQPLAVALIMEWMNPKSGECVMDVGAGSGWTAALLAEIVGPSGHVYAIERVPALCEFGERNVARWIDRGLVTWCCQDGTKGLPGVSRKLGGFDVIHAAAAAELRRPVMDAVPDAWKDQLKIGGRIVMPIGTSVWRFTKRADGWQSEEYPGFVFVPLVKE